MSGVQQERIENGIEWYTYQASHVGAHGRLEDYTEEECQCARCGSSAAWASCWNCGGEAFVEEDIGDDVGSEMFDVACGFCDGNGGRYRCIASPEWCNAHPMVGREHVESTALANW